MERRITNGEVASKKTLILIPGSLSEGLALRSVPLSGRLWHQPLQGSLKVDRVGPEVLLRSVLFCDCTLFGVVLNGPPKGKTPFSSSPFRYII